MLGHVDDLDVGVLAPLGLKLMALVEQGLLLVAHGGGALVVLDVDGLVLLGTDLAELLVDLLDLGRHRGVADAGAGARLIDEVDGLIRQVAVLDVAVGQVDGGLEGGIGVVHPVMGLVLVAQALQDAEGLLFGGLAHVDGLEATLEGRVLLHVLAVFVERGGADDLDLAAREGRLHDGGGIEAALGRAGADQGVHLVDEQNDVAVVADLLEHALQAVLKLAAVLGAGHQGGDIEHVDLLADQDVGHLLVGDELRQPLDHRGLAHARLADDERVVLGSAREDLHHALGLALAADNRVELSLLGLLGEVAAKVLEHAALL